MQPALLAAAFTLAAFACLLWLSSKRGGWLLWLGKRVVAGAASRTVDVLCFLMPAVVYFGIYLLLVCLVSFPFDRYFVSMTLFLPGAVGATLFEVWRRIPTRL